MASTLCRASRPWLLEPGTDAEARDGLEDRVNGLDSGADDYLTNRSPSMSCLPGYARCLRSVVVARPTNCLHVEGLSLDPASRQGLGDRTPIDLTARGVRACLSTSCDIQVGCTRGRILIERVWDFAFETDSNVVDVYIGYLGRRSTARSARTASRRFAVLGTAFARIPTDAPADQS